MKIYNMLLELGFDTDAVLLLESEAYPEAKRELAKNYYEEGDNVKGREA